MARPAALETFDLSAVPAERGLSDALARWQTQLRAERRVILSDSGNFPSDLYMAQGLIKALDKGYELKVVAPEAVMEPGVAAITHWMLRGVATAGTA